VRVEGGGQHREGQLQLMCLLVELGLDLQRRAAWQVSAMVQFTQHQLHTAWHSMAQHGTARHSTAQHGAHSNMTVRQATM
jgi:hypothetical protein